jgi:hypothetical protein
MRAIALGLFLLGCGSTPASSNADQREYPCCANGWMASCHGGAESAERFTTCGGGRCVTGGAECPGDAGSDATAAD